MINAFQDIISYEGNEWEDYLTKISLIDIFKDLIPHFKDKNSLTQGIRYIVWCYSRDSDCIILHMDWKENKKKVFDKTLLPKEYFYDLVELQNPIIIKTIQRWLDFQDSAVFSQLMTFKDLQQEMMQSATRPILKSSGEIDFDQKFKNACYVKDLGKMIDDLEQELIQNNMKLKDAYQELKTAKNKIKNTIGVETFATS